MTYHSFTAVDVRRVEQFGIIGQSARLITDPDIYFDESGFGWAVERRGHHAFAATWAGSNLIFDPESERQRHPEWLSALEAVRNASHQQQRTQLENLKARIRVGERAERLLWKIHSLALSVRSSVLFPGDIELAEALWGVSLERRPKHWRREISLLLKSLSRLHVGAAEDDEPIIWGADTALLTHAALLNRRDALCTQDCPWHNVPGHRHFLINVGRGFFGVLEELSNEGETPGVRVYDFPIGSAQIHEPGLWRLGKSGRLMSLYLPAKLGTPDLCNQLTHQQHCLLQAIVREQTRRKRTHRLVKRELQIIRDRQVPDLANRALIDCELLEENAEYITFGGNKKRRGCGYLLYGEHGWLSKSGYDQCDAVKFLKDLSVLANALELTIACLRRNSSRQFQWLTLSEVQSRLRNGTGSQLLRKIHLRIYAKPNFAQSWREVFQTTSQPADGCNSELQSLLSTLSSRGLRSSDLARGLGKDASLISKILRGKRRCSDQFIRDAQNWIKTVTSYTPILPETDKPALQEPSAIRVPNFAEADSSAHRTMVDIALQYRQIGWSIVPQAPTAKQPWVSWKPFQERLATEEEIRGWYERWPDSGIAVVLGRISNLLVIDVDGSEAHDVLLEHLGTEPFAPKVLSGSGQAYRYHLFFRCPAIQTKAKKTPWHPKLEFRGHGGIVIAPPSLHKSGNRYHWQDGRSIRDLMPPELPAAIFSALQPQLNTRPQPQHGENDLDDYSLAPSTMAFLSGEHSNGPNWNQLLFKAACDLCAQKVPREKAEAALLAGANPWNAMEADAARRTINSAFASDRSPSLI